MRGDKSKKWCRMKIDRLSKLPDPIIHHILSLMDTKYAVQTSILSKKWRYQWINIHSLNLDCGSFHDFYNFKVFCLALTRYSSLQVMPPKLQTLKFYLRHYSNYSFFVKKFFQQASLRGYEELETDLSHIPEILANCKTIKTLKLASIEPSSTLLIASLFPYLNELGLLRSLQLSGISLYGFESKIHDIFSSFKNLENLVLINVEIKTCHKFIISAPRLVKCTLKNFLFQRVQEVVITAQRLRVLSINNMSPLKLSIYHCPTLEKMNVRACATLLGWQEINDCRKG